MSEILLYGQEPYSIENQIARSKEKVAHPEFNVSEFEEFNSACLEICNTLPFMADNRLVIIKGDFSKKATELLKYLDDPTPTTNLIIYAKKFRKGTKLAKKIDVKKYDKASESKLIDYIKATLQPKKISHSLCKYLIERVGYLSDKNITFYDIVSSLDKLKHLEDDISEQLINDVVPKSISNSVFDIIDLVFRNRHEEAFEILMNLDDKGLNIIALFERAVRIMIKIQKGFSAKAIGIPDWNYKKLKGYNIASKTLGDILESTQHRRSAVLCGNSSKEEACEVFFIELLSHLKRI